MLKNMMKKQIAQSGMLPPNTSLPQTGAFKPKVITVADVQVGDLIFYERSTEDHEQALLTALASGQVHHVEICAVTSKITGLVNNAANLERGLEEQRQTRTIPLTPKKQDRLIVMHCKSDTLRADAAKYAVRWDTITIPFDEGRLTAAKRRKSELSAVREDFKATGRFRAIRYAARRGAEIYLETDDPKPTKGMFCSQFVVACYQVAGLAPSVTAAPSGTKVQDKKAKLDPTTFAEDRLTVVSGFKHYQFKDDANDPDTAAHAGIEYWKFETAGSPDTFAWDTAFTTGMMVDAKLVMPAPLLTSLMKDGIGWELKGVIMPAV